MNDTQSAIQEAYLSQIQALFTGFSHTVLENYNDADTLLRAQRKFKNELGVIEQARYLAFQVAQSTLSLDHEMLFNSELNFIYDEDDHMSVECGKCGVKLDVSTGKCDC